MFSLDSKIDRKNVGVVRHVEMPSNDGIVYLLTSDLEYNREEDWHQHTARDAGYR